VLDLARAVALLKEWAEPNPLIFELVVFGSQARGTARPDSDLDVAIRVRPGNEPWVNDQSWVATFMAHSSRWESELRRLLNFERVKLTPLEDVESRLRQEERIVVFRRQIEPPNFDDVGVLDD
jgi:predicted nucleotidyltransferase